MLTYNVLTPSSVLMTSHPTKQAAVGHKNNSGLVQARVRRPHRPGRGALRLRSLARRRLHPHPDDESFAPEEEVAAGFKSAVQVEDDENDLVPAIDQW